LKRCIACAEDIKEDALLCKHCGTRQDEELRPSRRNKSKPRARKSDKRILLWIVGLALSSAIIASAFAVYSNVSTEERNDRAAFEESMSRFCSAVIYGAWKSIDISDLERAIFGASSGELGGFESFQVAKVEDYSDNGSVARSLPSVPETTDIEMTEKLDKFRAARTKLTGNWPSLADAILPRILGKASGGFSFQDDLEIATTKLEEIREAIQYLTIECEIYVSR
jgi:hypothetical protein